MRRLLVLMVLPVALAACDASRQDGPTVTGRVTTRSADTVCVSHDPRRRTSECVQVNDVRDDSGLEEVDVGECASITTKLTSAGDEARVEVVDEAACAAGDVGDVGDDAPDR